MSAFELVTSYISLISVVHSIRFYVNPSNTIGGNGSDWETAFLSLERAISLLPEAGGANQIWLIGDEIYTPNTTKRDECFSIPRGTKIYGGFEGWESGINQRPDIGSAKYNKYTSILSGDIGVKNDQSDNCYHVITYDRLLTLDRVIISDGNANYNQDDYHANQINTLHRYGAALMTVDSTQKTELFLDRVTFTNNRAYNGGAMWFAANPNTPVDVSIVHCLFENNTAFDVAGSYGGGYGGAIYFYHLAVISILHSEFTNNYAQNRGMLIHNFPNRICHFSEISSSSKFT